VGWDGSGGRVACWHMAVAWASRPPLCFSFAHGVSLFDLRDESGDAPFFARGVG